MLPQTLKYVSVGALLYFLDLGVFSAIVLVDDGLYIWANVVARLAGAAVGFLLHRHWTFRGNHRHAVATQALMYASLLMANVVASSAILYLFVRVFGLGEIPARVLTDAIVIMSNFVASRAVIFRMQPGGAASEGASSDLRSMK
jgi:putative flippase GtrA